MKNNNETSVEISESLRQFIEALVEEVALEGKPFDTQKKWLRIYCEAEDVDYEALESNLNDLFEALDDWKHQKSKTSQLAARMLAKKLCLSENMVEKLVDERTPQPLPEPTLATEFVDPKLLMHDGKIEEVEIDGRLISPCGWRYACDFSEGLACVEADDGLNGYIDATGNIAIPCKWENASDFSEGLALVRDENGEHFFINRSGDIAIRCEPEIELYEGFHEGLAVVEDNQSKRYGFIDKTGRISIPCKWRSVSSFEDGLAIVWDDQHEKCGCIDATGNLVIPCIFSEGLEFHEGLSFVFSDENDREFVIDMTGRKVFDMKYEHYDGVFHEGLASAYDVGFVDKSGEVVIVDKWGKSDRGFSEGLAPTEEGYIDHSGKVVIPGDWEECFVFKEGLAMVVKDEKYGFIDHGGNMVVPCIWDHGAYAGGFFEGLARVQLKDKWYFINKQGKVLCKVKRLQ